MLAIAGALFGFKPTGNTLAAFLTAIPMLIGLIWIWFCLRRPRPADARSEYARGCRQFPRAGASPGTNFPVQSLPSLLIPISLMLPLTYGLDAVRGWLIADKNYSADQSGDRDPDRCIHGLDAVVRRLVLL